MLKSYYKFEPRDDITLHELAEIVRFFCRDHVGEVGLRELTPRLRKHFTLDEDFSKV